MWSSRKKGEPAKTTGSSSAATSITSSKSAIDGFAADKPSKHMSKKAKKAARKEAKVGLRVKNGLYFTAHCD